MYQWKPKRVIFKPQALEYERGQRLYRLFSQQSGVELGKTSSHNRVTGIPGKTAWEMYEEAKRTLVVGVRKSKEFATCKPSAHFQLPLSTSCPGKCEYCYLNTTLGKKPYVRIYVNIEEVLGKAGEYIQARLPEQTIFEGAATGDPLAVEDYSDALKIAIAYFADQPNGRFRFVTKFTNVDSLLDIEHSGHNRFRFSLNTEQIIGRFERGTPRLVDRIRAARKAGLAGYPLGFLIAPIFIYPGWQDDYRQMLTGLAEQMGSENPDITFELITHRYTARARSNILDRNPNSRLPMLDEERRYKYGQFGYGKYVYPQDTYDQVRQFFQTTIAELFPQAVIDYLV
jgi:spore photoproduct lyase